MRFITPILLALVAVVHLLPLTGVRGSEALERLYGVAITDPNLLVLMQHRAVLFGIIGGLLVGAVFTPAWRPLAIGIGLVSVVSFLLLAWRIGDSNPLIARVWWVDLVALALLLGAAGLTARRSSAPPWPSLPSA